MKVNNRIFALTFALMLCFTSIVFAGADVSSEDVKCIKVSVMEGERYGYILRSSGKWVIPPQFSAARDFQPNGLAVAGDDKKVGLIDLQGRAVGAQDFQSISPFEDGYAVVMKNGKFGAINEKGEIVLAPKYDYGSITFSEQLAAVSVNGKYGFVSNKDQLVIAPEFDKALPFHEGLAAVAVQGKFGFIDATGRFVIKPQYETAGSFSEGLAQVSLGGKVGFIDKAGTVVIPTQYQSASDFKEGLAAIESKDDYGYINKAGKKVVDPKYEMALPFKNGVAAVSMKDQFGYNRYGLINNQGYEVVPYQFNYEPVWEGDLIKVRTSKKTGYMDAKGRWIVKPELFSGVVSDYWHKQGIVVANDVYYDRQGKKLNYYLNYIHDAYDEMRQNHYDAAMNLFMMAAEINPKDKVAAWGMALATANKDARNQYKPAVPGAAKQQDAQLSSDKVVPFPLITEDGTKFGYMQLDTGRWVILPRFEEAKSFKDGLAQVREKEKYGFIRLDGTYAIMPEYDSTWYGFEEGLLAVKSRGQYGFVDNTGAMIIKPQFTYAGRFSEGLAPIYFNGNYGYINKQGVVVISSSYQFASDFVDGMAAVELDNKWGFINKSGQLVIPCQYENSQSQFSEGLASVKLNGKYGFVDKNGKMVIVPQYDNAEAFHEGLAVVRINNQYGVIDREGRYVVKPGYDKISDFNKGVAEVKLKGRFGYIDKKGQVVVPVQFEKVGYSPEDGLIGVYGNSQWGVMNTSGKWVNAPITLNAPLEKYWPVQKILVADGYYYRQGQGALVQLDHYLNHLKNGSVYLQQGDDQKAKRSFEAAIAINPGDETALCGLIQIMAKEVYLQKGLN
ncbi:hypothetical protein SRRS_41730 [Sporomusa rhizae]|uniref:WG repeat-containing protein n=1 Tax=Sporomusa rhizae TaxID=357999 RepID=UPI00352AAD15